MELVSTWSTQAVGRLDQGEATTSWEEEPQSVWHTHHLAGVGPSTVTRNYRQATAAYYTAILVALSLFYLSFVTPLPVSSSLS